MILWKHPFCLHKQSRSPKLLFTGFLHCIDYTLLTATCWLKTCHFWTYYSDIINKILSFGVSSSSQCCHFLKPEYSSPDLNVVTFSARSWLTKCVVFTVISFLWYISAQSAQFPLFPPRQSAPVDNTRTIHWSHDTSTTQLPTALILIFLQFCCPAPAAASGNNRWDFVVNCEKIWAQLEWNLC